MCHSLSMTKYFTYAVETFSSALRRLKAQFKSELPIGVEEFHKWAGEVIALTRLPDNDSMRWSLAVNIMHLPAKIAKISKQEMADLLHKGAANQVAAFVTQDLKSKQDAKVAEAATVPATSA
jgi:hypothetical protein